MQKPERKQHKERRRSPLILPAAALLLLIAGVAAFLLLSRPPQEESAPEEQHWGLLTDRQPEELVSVSVKRRGEDPWTLARAEDGTLRPENKESEETWTVPDQQTALLEETLTNLRYEAVLSEGDTPAESAEGEAADPGESADRRSPWQTDPEAFGLSDPLVTVTARFADGTALTVNIGNDTGLEDEWHYMTVEGDPRLYAVSSAVAKDLDLEYALLRAVPRPEILSALLDRITVCDSEKVIAEWRLRGSVEDRDAGVNWELTQPFRAPADEEAVANLKKTAENLRLGAYLAPATPENLEKYGFDIPRRVLLFHMAAGSTGTVSETGVYDVTDHAEKTVELTVGDSPDDLASYVRFGDDLYTVSTFTLSALTAPDPLSTVARYPVATPLDSLESLTVETFDKAGNPAETLEYVLLESSAADTASDAPETAEAAPEEQAPAPETAEAARRCFLNGEEIPYETFAAAYERLLTVTFSGRLPEGTDAEAAKQAPPQKKYTFRTQSGGTHTVELREWDGMHDAVTVDGSTLFYLVKGGMTPLPGESE